MLVRDNIITGNRTGIDINNSNGHTVRNNVIDYNRTGLIFRNQTDNMLVVENFITNNWTVGVLFLDASGGTNAPPQQALNSVHAQQHQRELVRPDRRSPDRRQLCRLRDTNLKNFSGNWFGTTSPVVTTANSAEPGYAAQIPVAYGGTATPPGGQPDIAGPASANFVYQPLLAAARTRTSRPLRAAAPMASRLDPSCPRAGASSNGDRQRLHPHQQCGPGRFQRRDDPLLGIFVWTETNAASSWARQRHRVSRLGMTTASWCRPT